MPTANATAAVSNKFSLVRNASFIVVSVVNCLVSQ
jgi:hypothetical protein